MVDFAWPYMYIHVQCLTVKKQNSQYLQYTYIRTYVTYILYANCIPVLVYKNTHILYCYMQRSAQLSTCVPCVSIVTVAAV